ncbi:anthocyanidin 3-O-glucoside 6''-O-acyltransferase-like [Salvia miltiorrhiza]|uniref:anthocyanidin 3-O-glucoside 6''-O-acyltransferase-like n=1 Tax=Salvia miltiorrhiza TaxID=226208 RepID=UPI0025AD9420|nr:anthocyanidin 3-O-glucoside 6''-O-acyltransferase-like [Salvia miltiorrhiza]
MTTALLETSQIAPPPEAAAEQSLPLTFMDIDWLIFHPIRRLIFYEFPCSKPHFLEVIVPKLKQSLSLTLKHFFPLAGNIVYPLNSGALPELRYIPGDSVPLSVCESSDDFDNFVANRARDADKFYGLIPQLPPMIVQSDSKLLRVLALQVTLFPDRGVCIGLANHHSAGDATSIAAFLRRWSSTSKIGGSDDEISISEAESLPIFDRSRFIYPAKLDPCSWNQIKEIPLPPPSLPLPTNRVRATYVLSKSELEKLKLSIQSADLGLAYVSSFVAMAAYVWSCLAKSSLADEEDDDRLVFFLIAIDARARLDPPVPDNYFGNCVVPGLARVRRREIISDGGVFAAAQATAKAIKDRVGDKKKILEGVENWGYEIMSAVQGSFLAVSGSARVDLYAADFGFGKARKVEVLSIDGEKYAFSLCKSRDFEGGLEIGLSLPKLEMEAFAACFDHGIKNL